MQVVHRADPRAGGQEGPHLGHVDRRGRGVEGQVEGLLHDLPAAEQDHRQDDQAGDRVDPGAPGQDDQSAGHSHAGRDRCVGGHVQEGRADVQVVRASAGEQQRRQAVHQHPGQGHADHQARGGGGGRAQALDGFPGDEAAGEHQDHRVGQSRQHRGLAEAVGAPGPRRPPRQPGRPARHGQRQHVGKIVPGVGQQGHGVAEDPRAALDQHEAAVEGHADQPAPVALRGRPVVVVVVMAVAVPVMRVAA